MEKILINGYAWARHFYNSQSNNNEKYVAYYRNAFEIVAAIFQEVNNSKLYLESDGIKICIHGYDWESHFLKFSVTKHW